MRCVVRNELTVYGVFLSNKTFIKKFLGSTEVYFPNGDMTGCGHAFSFLEDQPDDESIPLLNRFGNISDEKLIYVADCPFECGGDTYIDEENFEDDEDGELKHSHETILLTNKGVYIHYSDGLYNEIKSVPWRDIAYVEMNQQTCCLWGITDGGRKELASFSSYTLAGGANNSNEKKWKAIFTEVIKIER